MNGSSIVPAGDGAYYIMTVAGVAPAGTAYVVMRPRVLNDGGIGIRLDDMVMFRSHVVKAGDVLKVAGLPQLLRASASATMDENGNATLTIDPPIIAGGSPANNAALTVSDNTLTVFIASPPNLPPAVPGYFVDGMTLTFRESL